MFSRRRLYTISRADKARKLLDAERQYTRLMQKGQAIIASEQLKAVVCPPESFGGWHDSNAKCAGCGKGVYCLPVCSEVALKLCVKCAVNERLLFN